MFARCVHISLSHTRQRGPSPSPSVSTVWSMAIVLKPLP